MQAFGRERVRALPGRAQPTRRKPARSSAAEDEIHGANQAQPCPQVVQLERLVHIKHCKRHKHAQRDHFLHDLELPHVELRVADAVGRHLQEVLKQRNTPADQRRHIPGRRRQVLEVPVPGERHEHVAGHQQQHGLQRNGQGLERLH